MIFVWPRLASKRRPRTWGTGSRSGWSILHRRNWSPLQMNIVIIGGTRFIGAHVVRRLIAAGHSVTVYHRGKHQSKLPENVRHVIRQDDSMLVRSFSPELLTPQPDAVIHMIAMGEADARAALEFFRGNTGRMVWISSGDVYL